MTKAPVPDRRGTFVTTHQRGDQTEEVLNRVKPTKSGGLIIDKAQGQPAETPLIKAAKAAAEEAARDAITETPVSGQQAKRKKGNLIGVWIDDDMLARLDKTIKPGQTRPQAIRELLERYLP